MTTASFVEKRVEALLGDHDPAATDPTTFLRARFDAGLAWVWFPEGQGGLGLDPDLQAVVEADLARAGAPAPDVDRNIIGHGMAAPTIATHGSGDQRDRYLRRIFTNEDIWCQLFSEPGAGSDLAALATRAARDGDEWVVTGQKVWTTLGHVARYGLLVARTDAAAPKHKGLTYFVLDMHAPGPEGSVGKLAFAELNQRIYELCVDLMGMDGTLYESNYEMRRPDRAALTDGDPRFLFLRARANSIEGGTSEIMRNILCERVLGLPGEPRVDKDRPWAEVPR